MKRILTLVLALAMLVSCFSLWSCGDTASEGELTRMTVDINPSIEFMIGEDGKIASVTALNDDGSILIAGEAFIGKTPEQALELTVSLATENGYLVSGNAEEGANTVKISVSGDSKYAEGLKDKVEAKAKSVLESLDVEAKVERVEALKTEGLRAIAKANSILSDEELAAMSDAELLEVIKDGRIETATLLTEELRTAYFAAKEHKIAFAESEQTAAIINELGSIYAILGTMYSAALNTYSGFITSLDEARYDMLVSPESDYQKKLSELRAAKAELLEGKQYVATLEVGSEAYITATAELALTEQQYDEVLSAYEAIGEQVNAALTEIIAQLRTAEQALREIEAQIIDTDAFKAKLSEKATELESELNAAKDGFFAEFEAEHGEDIAKIEEALKSQKSK